MASDGGGGGEVKLLAKRGSKWVAITADGQQVTVGPGMKMTVGLSTMIEEPGSGEVKSLYDCYHDGSCPPDLEKMLPPKVEQALEDAEQQGLPQAQTSLPPASPMGLPGGPGGPSVDDMMGGGMPPPDSGDQASPMPPKGI